MDNLRIITSIALNNIKKWSINPRIYIIIIALFTYFYSRLQPIQDFCSTFGYKVTPYIFPFIMSDGFSVLLIMFGIVLLFCDAPFIESEQPYLIIRSGRSLWVIAQLFYIVLASAIYFLAILLMSFIILLPNLEFSLEWGKVIGTFAQTTVAPKNGISLAFDFYIINNYAPIESVIKNFCMAWFVSVFIGFLMFVLNSNVSKTAGSIVACILILLKDAVIKGDLMLIKISPVSWLSLNNIDVNRDTIYPGYLYIILILGLSIFAFTIISLVTIRKRDI